jgi:hypothetical protein
MRLALGVSAFPVRTIAPGSRDALAGGDRRVRVGWCGTKGG